MMKRVWSATGCLWDMGKARITFLVLFTTGAGLWIAPGRLPWGACLGFLLGTGLLVMGANILNCYIERDNDALMERTRNRPLPTGRINAGVTLWAGLLLGLVSTPILYWSTNLLTAVLGAIAYGAYVGVYTPMKRRSSMAVVVGALPGALPPLMGWTAVTGGLEAPGLALFGVLFCWQLPHFLAIAIMHKDDYDRGGMRVFPLVRGEPATRRHMLLWTIALVAVSLLFVPLQVAGTPYLVVATLLGLGFLWFCLQGIRGLVDGGWARRTFFYSIVYLPALVSVLVLDAA